MGSLYEMPIQIFVTLNSLQPIVSGNLRPAAQGRPECYVPFICACHQRMQLHDSYEILTQIVLILSTLHNVRVGYVIVT